MLKQKNIRAVLCGAYQENAYLVCPDGRSDAFIIDPGDGLSAIQSALAESGRTLAAILLTHGHVDHILAAQPLAEQYGATVYIHDADAEMLDDPEKSAYSPEDCLLPPPVALPRTVYGDTVCVCGETLHVLHTPGHTRGSVCLYDTDGGVIFTGDTLFRAGYGRTDLYGGSNSAIIASLTFLLALPPRLVALPGHGPATTIGAEHRRYGL